MSREKRRELSAEKLGTGGEVERLTVTKKGHWKNARKRPLTFLEYSPIQSPNQCEIWETLMSLEKQWLLNS